MPLTHFATSSKRSFPDLEDQQLADAGDLQGIGGSDDELYEPGHTAASAAPAN